MYFEHSLDHQGLYQSISGFFGKKREAYSIIGGRPAPRMEWRNTSCSVRPGKNTNELFLVRHADSVDVSIAFSAANEAFAAWSSTPVARRSIIMDKIADILNKHRLELQALLMEEAGKTVFDAIAEVDKAMDLCRYYGHQALLCANILEMSGPTGERNSLGWYPRGVFACISPWNFPLSIFIGQVVAALVCGNTVVAKPAISTSNTGMMAVQLMHKAGVPTSALNLIVGKSSEAGERMLADYRLSGVCFTGSTYSAQQINKILTSSYSNRGIVPFIAETGGQNAMIVDASAILARAVKDAMISAICLAGQRCSALRIMYIHEDIYDQMIEMLTKAIQEVTIGDTVSDFSVDIGPVISRDARRNLEEYVRRMLTDGKKMLAQNTRPLPSEGFFFAPCILEVDSINDIPGEQFGPILHVAKFSPDKLDGIIEEINDYGFGLTFGVQSSSNSFIEYVVSRIRSGNIYVNCPTVGSKVGVQPFGGERNSGTGFKAGGPHYLYRFMTERTVTNNLTAIGGNIALLK